MKSKKAIAITNAFEQNTYRVGFWALLALLVLIAATSCTTMVQPTEESDRGQGQAGWNQDAPPTQNLDTITVDLSAIEPDRKSRAAAKSCRDLHGPLRQIVEAADPAREAKALGLIVRETRVQVILVLNDQGTTFLRLAGVDVGKQAGKQVQAFVPISQLCELAADKRVDAIYPAHQAETQ